MRTAEENAIPAVFNRKRGERGKAHDMFYNEKGILIDSRKDLCDCLDETCCGCFFSCLKCRSTKCGPECRQKRKYVYEYHEVIGTGQIIRNYFKPT